MSDDDDDESLLAKIQVLLDGTHYDEFLLIVLVLLTRVVDAEKVQQIWTEHADTLNEYCRRLQQNNPQYLHIVARNVSRLKPGSVGVEVFQVLWNALRAQNKAPLSAFDVDLVLALNVYVPQDSVNEVLDTVWQRFHFVQVRHDVKDEAKEDEMLIDDTGVRKDWKESSSADWKLVHDTLEALLTADYDDLMTSFHQAVLLTFITHGQKACEAETIPSWYKPMMLWVTNTENGPPSSLVPQWHAVVLQCTRQLTISYPKEFQQVLLHSKSISTALIQLILFYITSTAATQSETDLPSWLGWTTLAAMVEAFGFDWMMLPGSGSLGNATSLCTILRLATGEWRIQLGRLCVDESSDSASAIVDSCGRVIVAALHHVVHLAEEKKEKFQIQASALLHLRDSLQDALHATVQYLCQPQQDTQHEHVIAGRVLGGLLTEFDVWDGLPSGVSTDETLQALSVALQSAGEDPKILMPCLVMVLASIEDPDYCIKFLDKHHLLGKTLINFLVSFWKNLDTEDPSQCTEACQVADLWSSLTTPPASVTAPVRKAILHWIRKQVDSSSPKVSVLSSAVDCYVMLFGQDAVPSEREARVVQRALEICEAQKSS